MFVVAGDDPVCQNNLVCKIHLKSEKIYVILVAKNSKNYIMLWRLFKNFVAIFA